MSNQQRHAELDAIITELDARANGASHLIDFEEKCGNCHRLYCYHETRVGCKGLATYCPSACTVFRLPDREDVLEREGGI